MKKILIVSHSLEVGGAERSLLGLLEAIDNQNYCVDLFLLRHTGELLPYVPSYVNILPEIPAYTVLARPMKETLREGHVLLTTARLIGKVAATLYNKKHQLKESAVSLDYSHKFTRLLMPRIQKSVEYDLAISFLTPHYFVAEKVHAKKKIAWIHTDYSKVAINVKSETAMWSRYDRIISISKAVSEKFLVVFPTLRDKLSLIENILPEKIIRKQASSYDTPMEMQYDGNIRILSIGRFCYPKNFDNIPSICSYLIRKKLKIKWYVIGYGGDETLIRKKINEYHMEDNVIILGKKENPYPYIMACDLYVQPSRYEGKCVTVREAQMLGKPVVITDYATSASQLEDGVDGLIVPIDNKACAEGIAALLSDPLRMEGLAKKCTTRDYSNIHEVNKIYEYIENL